VNILLIDDHRLMRDGLRAVLENAGLSVVGEGSNGREVFPLVDRLKPDIVLMDITMPELNGIDATRRLLGEHPEIKVIALSMNSDRRYVVAMFKAGAVGYLLKTSACEELIVAIRTVSEGLNYVSPAIAAQVIGDLVGDRPPMPAATKPLSLREREVLQLLAEGKSSKEIAVQLALAVPTVETHRRQITEKLGLHSIAELTKYAIREGLTALD
jgi:two-component system response regulator NreC